MDPGGAKGGGTLKNRKAGSIFEKLQEVGIAEVIDRPVNRLHRR